MPRDFGSKRILAGGEGGTDDRNVRCDAEEHGHVDAAMPRAHRGLHGALPPDAQAELPEAQLAEGPAVARVCLVPGGGVAGLVRSGVG